MQLRSLESITKVVTMLPQTVQAVGALTSDPIDTAGWGDVLILVPVGELDADATVTAKVAHAPASDGDFVDIDGAAFPAVCTETAGPQDGGGSGDGKCYGILLREGSRRRWIKGTVTVAEADSLGGVGMVAVFFGPASSAAATGVRERASSGEGIVAAV